MPFMLQSSRVLLTAHIPTVGSQIYGVVVSATELFKGTSKGRRGTA